MNANANSFSRPALSLHAILLAIILLCAVFPQACKKAGDADAAAVVTVQAEHPLTNRIP